VEMFDQPDAFRAFTGDGLTAQNQGGGVSVSDEPRQSLRSTGAGKDSHTGFEESERCARVCHAYVRSESQLEAPARRLLGDGRDAEARIAREGGDGLDPRSPIGDGAALAHLLNFDELGVIDGYLDDQRCRLAAHGECIDAVTQLSCAFDRESASWMGMRTNDIDAVLRKRRPIAMAHRSDRRVIVSVTAAQDVCLGDGLLEFPDHPAFPQNDDTVRNLRNFIEVR